MHLLWNNNTYRNQKISTICHLYCRRNYTEEPWGGPENRKGQHSKLQQPVKQELRYYSLKPLQNQTKMQSKAFANSGTQMKVCYLRSDSSQRELGRDQGRVGWETKSQRPPGWEVFTTLDIITWRQDALCSLDCPTEVTVLSRGFPGQSLEEAKLGNLSLNCLLCDSSCSSTEW